MKNPVKSPAEWFDRWPDYFGSKIGACDVLAIYKDGSQWFYPSNGCHGVLYNIVPHSLDKIYSSLWCRHEELFEAAKEYWGYLLSPELSPFRAALPGMEWVYDKKGRPLAFGLLSQGVPNQLCVPLMMQCRVPQENSTKLAAFKLFRENGFDLVESFFLSEHFYYIDGLLYKVNSSYQHAFNPFNGINIDCLRAGAPSVVNKHQSWKSGSVNWGPVTAMWATGKPSKIWSMALSPQKYTGVFPKAFQELRKSDSFEVKNSSRIQPSPLIEALKADRTGW